MKPGEVWSGAKILIVDDLEANVHLLHRILSREGYANLWTAGNGRSALRLVDEIDPDLILLDLMMPELGGIEVLRQLGERLPSDAFLPVLILTADASPQSKRKALSLGAMDFITKPFDAVEVLLRARNLLHTRALHLHMEKTIQERTQSLREAHIEILERLAQAGEFRDDETGLHAHRVGEMSARIAETMGLPRDAVDLIRRAAPLHDLGKIAVSDSILLKPGKLTEEEWPVMKRHTTLGAMILRNGRADLVRVAERIARHHHERWDGAGYPEGLAGDAIPLEARIVAVADVYDALTHDRPYRRAWPAERVTAKIIADRGSHFDPHVVDAFQRLLTDSSSLASSLPGSELVH